MPYRTEMLISSAKFTLSLFGVGGLWFAQTVTDSVNWVERYGITGAIIVALITVIKLQWNNDQKARVEALAAKDALIVAAKENAALHLATTTELIAATNHQTAQLEKFTDRLVSMDEKVARCGNQQFPFNRKQPETPTV